MLFRMTDDVSGLEEMKRAAAMRALALVESGMRLGLGTGSTARWFVEELGARVRDGALSGVAGVATSAQTEALARSVGVPLIELPADGVDLAVDGMDELTPDLQVIKGLGGALTREKIVAASAARFVLIGDETKRVSRLGEKAPLPVEVLAFGAVRTAHLLGVTGGQPTLRLRGGERYVTDNGNLVFDLHFAEPFDPRAVAAQLDAIPGVVEHGLFLDMVERAFVAGRHGVSEVRR